MAATSKVKVTKRKRSKHRILATFTPYHYDQLCGCVSNGRLLLDGKGEDLLYYLRRYKIESPKVLYLVGVQIPPYSTLIINGDEMEKSIIICYSRCPYCRYANDISFTDNIITCSQCNKKFKVSN